MRKETLTASRIARTVALAILSFGAVHLVAQEPEADPAAPPGQVWSEEHGHYHPASEDGHDHAHQPDDGFELPTPQAAPTAGPLPQPPGPVPEGKVWSGEHGHWHDADAAVPAPQPTSKPSTAVPLSTISLPSQDLTPGPQPDGPVPPGKTWNSEHGHWHDAPGAGESASVPIGPPATVAPGATLTPVSGLPASPSPGPQPDGPAPPGKVWSAEHGHWHDAPGAGGSASVPIGPPTTVAPGATLTPVSGLPASPSPGPQPDGPAPPGKVWSAEHGHWHDAPGTGGSASVPIGPPTTVAPGATLTPVSGLPASPSPGPQPDGPAPPGKVWSAEHGHWHDAPASAASEPEKETETEKD